MPIYAYKCSNCGFEKDELQKISAAPLVDCPACGKPELKKQLTAAGFQLKGSGWYVTDFRDGGKAPATGAAPAKAADSTGAAEPAATPAASTSEAKPAAEPAKAASPAPAATPPSTPAA